MRIPGAGDMFEMRIEEGSRGDGDVFEMCLRNVTERCGICAKCDHMCHGEIHSRDTVSRIRAHLKHISKLDARETTANRKISLERFQVQSAFRQNSEKTPHVDRTHLKHISNPSPRRGTHMSETHMMGLLGAPGGNLTKL